MTTMVSILVVPKLLDDIVDILEPQPDDDDAAPPPKRRRRRRRPTIPLRNSGKAVAFFLCVASTIEPETRHVQNVFAKSVDVPPHIDVSLAGVIAVVLVSWAFLNKDEPLTDDHDAHLEHAERKKHRRASILGFLRYAAESVHPLDSTLFQLPENEVLDAAVYAPSWVPRLGGQTFAGQSLQALCRGSESRLPSSAFVVSAEMGEILIKSHITTLSMLPLCVRMNHVISQPGYPDVRVIKKWIAEQRNVVAGAANDDDAATIASKRVLLALPPGATNDVSQKMFWQEANTS